MLKILSLLLSEYVGCKHQLSERESHEVILNYICTLRSVRMALIPILVGERMAAVDPMILPFEQHDS